MSGNTSTDIPNVITFRYAVCSACGERPEDHVYGLYVRDAGGEETFLCTRCTRYLVEIATDAIKAKLQAADSEVKK